MPISINLISGSGAHQGRGSWIFSGMARRIVQFADPNEFEIVVTEKPDLSRPYDVYHYLHSTLAVNHQEKLHRSLVTVVALDDIAEHRTFASKRETLQKCRRMSTICRDVRDSLIYQGAPEGLIEYTPIGVDLEAFAPTGEDREAVLVRRGGTFIDGQVRIGLVGRSYPDGRKGEEFLSNILTELSMRNADTGSAKDSFCMVFIGAWNGKAIIEKASLYDTFPRVEYDEHIIDETCTYEDYPDLYETLDGIVVTSKTESGPACILEALAKGLPIISTPGGMANEFLTRRMRRTKDKIGAVISHNDVHGFVDAIEEHILNPEFRRSVEIRRGVSQVLVDPGVAPSMSHGEEFPDEYPYSWENWAARFQRIYREMAAEMEGKQFFLDHLNLSEKESIEDTFHQRADSSLPDLYLENFMNVMDYCKRGIGLKHFANILRKKPAIIVGVGPSLTGQLPLIERHQNDVVIISCDAAIPVLTRNGITPHVVVVADPTERQIANFHGTDCSGFLTVMPTIVHPMVFHESRKSDCHTIWYNIIQDGSLICRLIPKVVGQKGGLIPGVLTTGMALQVAMYMGCWPITFVGHDLCWYDVNGDGYAEGVAPSKIEWQRANKMAGKDVLIVPDIHGDRVTTEINFFVFTDWVNRLLQSGGLRIHNSTGCGILYGENIVQMPLEGWIEGFSQHHDAAEDLAIRFGAIQNQVDQDCCHQYDEETMVRMRSLA
jgi:glycosyltransferase involved in cell wall biosynthesis